MDEWLKETAAVLRVTCEEIADLVVKGERRELISVVLRSGHKYVLEVVEGGLLPPPKLYHKPMVNLAMEVDPAPSLDVEKPKRKRGAKSVKST